MNTEFFKLSKSPQEGDQGRKEKSREDGIIWVRIHIYMEMSI
jgi:hypothetical protein